MSLRIFPTLYDIASTGKVKQWDIKVTSEANKSVIVTETGYIDGKITTFTRDITKGKNLGRANATTHYEQAISEAESKWNKQKDKGYSETIPGSSTASSTSKKILPMLALNYTQRGSDIHFPSFCQPKLDGIRAIFYSGKLHSRMGKVFPHLTHINDELKKLPYNLDGELYTDKISFQEITGIVRKQKLTKSDAEMLKKVKFQVYDVVSSADYIERLGLLGEIFNENKFHYVVPVKTEICNNKKDVQLLHDTYVLEGYEGLMLRNFEGGYTQKNRSKNLQKYKEFEDAEFLITGYKEGDGKEKGMIIFECITSPPEARVFDVRPVGTYTERKKMWKDRESFIGKLLTVKYFGVSNEGTPRFPVGLSVRDYE
jgi:DNA ligase-1